MPKYLTYTFVLLAAFVSVSMNANALDKEEIKLLKRTAAIFLTEKLIDEYCAKPGGFRPPDDMREIAKVYQNYIDSGDVTATDVLTLKYIELYEKYPDFLSKDGATLSRAHEKYCSDIKAKGEANGVSFPDVRD